MEDQVDLPLGGDAEMVGCPREHFLDFKWSSSFHLEFLGSTHMEIGCLQLYSITNFPRGELQGDPFPHLLLSYFVDSLSIIVNRGQVS